MLAAAVCLFASELMTLFEFTPAGRRAPSARIDNGDRHANAQMVVAGFAIVGVAGRGATAARGPAAFAVAAMGVLALLIFLIADLRFANTVGSLSEACGAGSSFFDAEAVPQGGFYLRARRGAGAGRDRHRPRDADPRAARRVAPRARASGRPSPARLGKTEIGHVSRRIASRTSRS